MAHYFAQSALLPTGWAQDVRLEVDERGDLVTVQPDASPEGAESLMGVAIPGMVNLHSHAFQRAMAGLAERGSGGTDSFWTWRELMYGFLDRLTPKDCQAVATQLYVEMLCSGYTSVVEFHYVHLDREGRPYSPVDVMSQSILAAASSVGIGLTHLPVVYLHGGFGGAAPAPGQRRFTLPLEDVLALVESLAEAASDEGQIRIGLGLHSLRAVTPEELQQAVAGVLTLDAHMPIHIHVAEQEREVRECLDWSGARPVEWLLSAASVDERWCLIHATHMTSEESASLARSGAVVGLCPTTEANLGDGLFALSDFLQADGRIGVGSDSHVSVSPSSELRLLEYGQRLHHRRRNVAMHGRAASTGAELLRQALRGGAQAAGRRVGALEAGSRADVVVLDPDHPTLTGRSQDDLLDSWVFAEAGSPVRDVLVGGRWVVRDGRHSSSEVVADGYRQAMRRLLAG